MGIYPDYNGLRVHPCIPDDWSEYTVTRRFRGCEYTIHVCRGEEKGITVNGAPISGEIVPLMAEPSARVEVELQPIPRLPAQLLEYKRGQSG